MTARQGLIVVAVVAVAVLAGISAAIWIGHRVDLAACHGIDKTRQGLITNFQGQASRAKRRAGVDIGLAHNLDLQAQVAAEKAVSQESLSTCGGLFP